MQLIPSLIVAGALGAVAHPSGLNHRHVHPKRDLEIVHEVVTVYVTEEWPPQSHTMTPTPSSSTGSLPIHTATAPTTPVAGTPVVHLEAHPSSSSSSSYPAHNPAPTPATPTTSTTLAAAPASTDTQPAGPGGSDEYIPFCQGNSKRATLGEIARQGNLGTTYGCNIMEVPSQIAPLYNYTATFHNVDNVPYQVICANKIGRDHGINGFFKGNEAVIFQLASGASQVVAFEANSLGSCFFAPKSVPTSSLGLYLGTWFEFSYADSTNNDWSGADCSSLTAMNNNGAVYGCQVCEPGSNADCSTILPGGSGKNAFNKVELASADGLGLNMPPSPRGVHLAVVVGYNGPL